MKLGFEENLKSVVVEWLKKKGCNVLMEICPFSASKRKADIIAIDQNEKVIAVEIKQSPSYYLLWQSYAHLFYSDYVYSALPEQYSYTFLKRYSEQIKELGLGILSIRGDEIVELLQPIESTRVVLKLREELKRTLKIGGVTHE